MSRLLALLAMLAPTPLFAEPIRVVAVNSVLADFARLIGGEHVAVEMPVPEGVDPATWMPSAAEIAAIQTADLIILNGAGYAAWTQRTSIPRSRTVVTTDGLEGRFITAEDAVTHSHGAAGAHSHGVVRPMTWLDFSLASEQAKAIAAGLEEALSAPVEASGLLASLAELDARASTLGERIEGPLIASHPSYDYFAEAYGIEILSVAWDPGAAPSEEDLAELDAILAEDPATIFLWERAPVEDARVEISERNLSGIVFDTGANDDLSFLERMSRNLDALEAGLGG